jgi:hypothetical protein
MSILSTIMRVESGGRNITQGNIGDINNLTGDLAQGYFQITGGTWKQFGGPATGYSSAIKAPYSTQLSVAMNIPVARWGSASQNALKAAGYQPQPGETLGQMLTRYGENPADTVPADGSSGAGATIAAGPPDASAGVTAGSGAVSSSGAGGAVAAAAGAGQGAPVTLGIQASLQSALANWITGAETGTFNAVKGALANLFPDIQNWFVRAGLIVLGIVLMAIGLMELADPGQGTKLVKSVALA